MIPLVDRITRDITDTYRLLEAALIAADDASEANDATYAIKDAEARHLLNDMQAFIDELERLGGTIKDMQVGLVDFYGDMEGQVICYCWIPGEDVVNFSHPVDKTCACRTIIDFGKHDAISK